MQQAQTQMDMACSQCGRVLAQSDLVQIAGNWVCGECKTAYLSRVVAGDPRSASGLEYANVGIRFAARFLDGLVALVPIGISAFLFGSFSGAVARNPFAINGGFLALALIFALFYEVLMLRYWGATVGKMVCKLRIVRGDGSSLGWGVCFGRYLMYDVVISSIPFVNWILLITTAIMASRDDEHRGLHDRVCDTRVIYNR